MERGSNFWGKLIVELRREQGLSRRGLARLAAINRATLKSLEEGATRGNIETVEQILNCLGYELEAIRDDQAVAGVKETVADMMTPTQRSQLAVNRLLQLTAL